MITRSVIGWDRSPESIAALEWALARARSGDEIVLVTVTDEETWVPGKTIGSAQLADETRELQTDAEKIHARLPDVRVTADVVVGDPLTALRRYSGPDTVVVVGTGRHTHPRFRFGWSLGSRLAASALGPVAIIPVHNDGQRAGVTVGVDGSETSTRAVLVAAAEAERRGTSLRIIYAWQEPPIWQEAYVLDEEYLDELGREYQETVDRARRIAQRAFPQLAVTSMTVQGGIAQALLTTPPLPELVVVGCRSQTRVDRFLLGSTSHEVVLNMDCPLLVVSDRVREIASDPDRALSRAELQYI